MTLTFKELNAALMGLEIVLEDCNTVLEDKTRFNKEAKTISIDLKNTCVSAINKIKAETGLKDTPQYEEGDEKEFIINPKDN